jgi:hypothetical protein
MNIVESSGMQLDAKTFDNKLFIHETSRPLYTTIYFTSEGDSTSNPVAIGGGDLMTIDHTMGSSSEISKFIDFNVKENRSFIHEGYVMWQDATFDAISMGVYPKITPSTSGSNTYFNSYGGYLAVPAAGDGSLSIQAGDIKLVEMPLSFDDHKRPTAFWNADYDTTSHTFSNITAAPNGDGTYNIFTAEVPLSKFVHKTLLLDNGFIMLQSADVSEIGHGMRLKLTMHTHGSDHPWKAACILTFNREKTC